MDKKYTLVIGASENPARYSNLVIKRLVHFEQPVVAIGKKMGEVAGVKIETEKHFFENIDTITLYLSAPHQKEYYDYILSLQPKRLIFNPGAENDELVELALQNNIKPLEACSLVLLNTGQY